MRLFLLALVFLTDSYVYRVNDYNFFDTVSAPGATLVKFFTPHCSHCQEMGPTFSTLSQMYENIPGLRFAECNLEESPFIQDHFNIEFVPELMWFTPLSQHPIHYDGGNDIHTLISFLLSCSSALPF